MTTFVLIPGAGGVGWYWHRLQPLIEQASHEALAVDLPGDDARAGLSAYADLTIASIGSRDNVALVAQSMGGFTAALVCARARKSLRMLVLVNAMIPLPGETAGAWWEHTGWAEARTAAAKHGGYSVEFDLATYFLHDVPREVAEAGAAHERSESEIAFSVLAPSDQTHGRDKTDFHHGLHKSRSACRTPMVGHEKACAASGHAHFGGSMPSGSCRQSFRWSEANQ